MAQIDPHTYLWSNMVALAGLGKTPSLDRMKDRVKIGRGIVQRIKDGGGVELKSIVTIAENLGVPVWRLLHPETGALSGWTATTLSVASLCNRQEPSEQQRMLDVLTAMSSGPKQAKATTPEEESKKPPPPGRGEIDGVEAQPLNRSKIQS